MSRILDLDEKENEWLSEINKRNQIVQECDSVIADQQSRKQKAIEDIELFNQFILFGRKMSGLNTIDLDQQDNKTLERERLLKPSLAPFNESVTGLKLPQAIVKVISSSPKNKLSVTEIYTFLLNAGFKSSSDNFRNIVYNTLHRLTGKYLKVDKKDGENYYQLMTTEEISGKRMQKLIFQTEK